MIPIPRLGNAGQALPKDSEGAIQKRKEEFLMGSLGYGGAKKAGSQVSGSVAITGGSTIASTQYPMQEATVMNANVGSSMVCNPSETKSRYQRSKQYFKMNSFLYSKYSSSQNYYFIKEINEILSDARCVELIRYRQLSDFCQPKEYLQEFVQKEQCTTLIKSLTDYYRYHKEIPRMFAKSVYDLYFEHHDLKRRVEYVIITKQLKVEKASEDCKVAAEEKLRKLRQKKYDPMLVGLPEYSFIQKYYHHRESRPIFGEQQSRTCYSIFDKLNKVVNNSNISKLSGQSFLQVAGGASVQHITGIGTQVQPGVTVQSSSPQYPGFGPQHIPAKHPAPKGTLLSALFSRPDPAATHPAPVQAGTDTNLFNFAKNKKPTGQAASQNTDLERIFAVGRKANNVLAKSGTREGPSAKRGLFLEIEGVGEGVQEHGVKAGEKDVARGLGMAVRTKTLEERIREFSRSESSGEKAAVEREERTEGTRQSDGLNRKRKLTAGGHIPNPVHKKKVIVTSKSKKVAGHMKKQSSDIFSSTHEDAPEKGFSTRGRKSQDRYVFTGLRATLEDERNLKPRSLSKKKKQSPAPKHTGTGLEKTKTLGHPEGRSINFNFNWTKVNKVLTNPLLINKSLAPSAVVRAGGKTQREKVAESSVGSSGANPQTNTANQNKTASQIAQAKNYLDTKSKLVKGYHHKMNSMVVSHDSGPFGKVGTREEPPKVKRELDVFSRKNSYGETDMKALLGIKTSQGFSGNVKDKETSTAVHSTRPRFISHSKKNSIYDLMLPESLVSGGSSLQQQKKSLAMRKRKKKMASLHTFEPSVVPRMKQEYSTSVLVPSTQGPSGQTTKPSVPQELSVLQKHYTTSQAHSGPGNPTTQHKHTKSEPERLFISKPAGMKFLAAQQANQAPPSESLPWDQEVTKRFHLK